MPRLSPPTCIKEEVTVAASSTSSTPDHEPSSLTLPRAVSFFQPKMEKSPHRDPPKGTQPPQTPHSAAPTMPSLPGASPSAPGPRPKKPTRPPGQALDANEVDPSLHNKIVHMIPCVAYILLALFLIPLVPTSRRSSASNSGRRASSSWLGARPPRKRCDLFFDGVEFPQPCRE